MEKIIDVCIIGAGWSGLLACKYAKENGLSVLVLERRAGLGGVWKFSNAPDLPTVMKSTITSSSTAVTEAADFPMDDQLGNFVHRKDILRYLEAYAQHFNLDDHILFNKCANTIQRSPEHWTIDCDDGSYFSKYLVICSGTNQQKRVDVNEIQGFSGPVKHVGEIKSIQTDDYDNNAHVLVYGGGESASDIVELLTETPARITWAIPGGQHFFRKASIFQRPSVGKYNFDDRALDEALSKFIQLISPPNKSKPGYRWICNLLSTGSVLAYEGHGIPDWRKKVSFFRAMINKNGHVVDFVRTGRVRAKGKILKCENQNATFVDGVSEKFTHLILCTGYNYSYPFLPSQYASRSVNEHYKLIFNPVDPSLLLIGFARPTILSIPFMTELQCLYAFKVISDKIKLPDEVAMLQEIQKDNDYRNNLFSGSRRADNLVNPFNYGYDVANLAGANPNYTRLFFKSPIMFFKTYFSPMSAAHFLLNDHSKRSQAVQQIWNRQHVDFFLVPFIFLAARVIQLDRIFSFLMNWKYKRTQHN